ncbi:MAG: glutaredoxin domain-containing protein [Nanoarchaeota archaeon]|nr:glutaredoxin domain-containing protein [Nanoarchaeota archaeon]
MNFAKIEAYMRPTCKDCQEMVKFFKDSKIQADVIDITSTEGYEISKDQTFYVLPTVLLKDDKGGVVETAFCVNAIKRILGKAQE